MPITVRHLESMIRMAEASARMALREYVRGDDIDLAISVAIGSFVSAQKMSIKKTLERVSVVQLFDGRNAHVLSQGFRKYLTQARDHEELLAFILGQIVKEKARLYQLQRYRQPEKITLKVSELDERVCLSHWYTTIACITLTLQIQAKEHDIFDTVPFLHSKLFVANGYTHDNGIIEKTFKQSNN